MITVDDMVEVERRLTDALGIERWAQMVGPSLGGMRVLEWLVAHPERVAAALVIGTTAALGADQIGSHEAQIEAIRADQRFRGGDYYGARAGEGPHRGLGMARRIAQLSYRSRTEMELRFGRSPQIREDPFAWKDGRAGGRFAIASFLDHHADKLARRFDANSTIALTKAMSLFRLSQQEQITALAPGAHDLQFIRSLHGHDGFLVESEQLGAIVRDALGICAPPVSPP